MIKQCAICGKDFDCGYHRERHSTDLTCSPAHREEYQKKMRPIYKQRQYWANPEKYRRYAAERRALFPPDPELEKTRNRERARKQRAIVRSAKELGLI